ncbi:hypothetical protein MASR2M47_08460 [Draconibacterium sp.]|jgi:hypothetical protein
MKKIIAVLIMTVALSACYDDYVLDYDYDGIYFPYQLDVRTFVVGEGMKIDFGVTLGGVRDNVRDRVVNYQMDNSLISPQTLQLMQASSATYIKNSMANVSELKVMPTGYYTLSDNAKMVIKKNEYTGVITVKPDSAKFLSNPATINAVYALGMRITSADADTIIALKDYAVVAFKYENMLYGNYWHGGVTIEKDQAGAVVNKTEYYTTIPSPEAKIWQLSTVAPFELTTNGVSDVSSSSNPEMKITLSGGNVTISSVSGAKYQVLPDGASTYNQAKLLQNRRVYLNYKYQNENNNWCYAKDTLTFRNRVRDGINEWRDENPLNYK